MKKIVYFESGIIYKWNIQSGLNTEFPTIAPNNRCIEFEDWNLLLDNLMPQICISNCYKW